ncbi:NepR family anti-sigma factor [Blastomonas sp.]|uniref:NepR family anti-sigma factor n=1 Tax=Blastomonas sp. TaxID=1909299 RepID=UPI00262493E0|nr:NepR family anti-sigma factor [Blastomonas sp.]MDM7955010.1 NepR family anti-sigma factor [Blastomonas sp.]
MLVHRENDDQSGDELSGKDGKPPLAHRQTTDDASAPLSDGQDSANAPEEGKTHVIGDALKSVYQRTLEEDIPDDFLDLLKQLK